MQGGAVFRPVRETAQRDITALQFPAKIRMSLHTRRPNNLLMMDCALPLHQEDCGLIENSRRLAAKLPQL